jgi:Protein of unknown function (DUF2778)
MGLGPSEHPALSNSAHRQRPKWLAIRPRSPSVASDARPDGRSMSSDAPAAAPAIAETPHIPEARDSLLSRPDSRTAIYDITAHAVYLPNGDILEAHSGLGGNLDDPRAVTLKGRGPTPPNVYALLMRDQPFHGVRAIRLIPLDQSRMFGRDGMLAHTYMRGPTGQSNGCVSFRDYPAFLGAFLKGEIDRLVVVDHLPGESS